MSALSISPIKVSQLESLPEKKTRLQNVRPAVYDISQIGLGAMHHMNSFNMVEKSKLAFLCHN
jgi:hypothetical protein